MKSYASKCPLRRTTRWPGFRESRPIPQRYGPCGGEALQYDGTRTRFVWNDAASGGIDRVDVAGQRSTSWIWRNAPDVTGQPVTFIEFSTPVPEGQAVVARGRGKLHPARGHLMTNPADVLWDVLANVGGLAIPEARLAAFRQQALALDVGGSIENDEVTLFAVARSICDSIGAVCSPDMPGFARLWPDYDGPAVATIGASTVEVDADAQLEDLCSDLTIQYAFEAGQPRGAVQFVTTRTPVYGHRADTIDAPWIATSRVAALVCERLLRLRARKQYVVTIHGYDGELRIGQTVELAHPLIPPAGTHMIQQREYSVVEQGARTDIVLRAPVGAVPAVRLLSNNNASEPKPTIEISATQPAAGFVVTVIDDETGQPLANAECTLDGEITRRADSAGRVSFPSRYATRGEHTIVAVAPGRDPVTLILTVT